MSGTNSVIFKKAGRLKPRVGRKPNNSDDEARASSSSSEDEGKVVKNVKAKRSNPFVQSTAGVSKRQAVEYKNESASDDDDEFREKNKLLNPDVYESSKTTERVGPRDMGATATLEIETEHDKDAQSQFERIQSITKEMKGKADDKVYRGMGAYGQFYEKKDTAIGNASSGLNRKGPIRAPNFVRQSVRWDYQPDICKDYKETGFCGFGDSCKFLHDRSDYKHGWELERDWKEGRYGKTDADPHAFEVSDEDEDKLPFKCAICRESFTNPVVTKCKHYFCEKCALERFRSSAKCYVCEKNTGGVFNPAKEIIAKLKGDQTEKRKRDNSSSAEDGDGLEDDVQETPMERLPDVVDEHDSGSVNEDDASNDESEDDT